MKIKQGEKEIQLKSVPWTAFDWVSRRSVCYPFDNTNDIVYSLTGQTFISHRLCIGPVLDTRENRIPIFHGCVAWQHIGGHPTQSQWGGGGGRWSGQETLTEPAKLRAEWEEARGRVQGGCAEGIPDERVSTSIVSCAMMWVPLTLNSMLTNLDFILEQ